MSQEPIPDAGDTTFSVTVIIYSENLESFELGYFDFEQNQWSHFGKNEIVLKCWCYIPIPEYEQCKDWPTLQPKGYSKPLF